MITSIAFMVLFRVRVRARVCVRVRVRVRVRVGGRVRVRVRVGVRVRVSNVSPIPRAMPRLTAASTWGYTLSASSKSLCNGREGACS